MGIDFTLFECGVCHFTINERRLIMVQMYSALHAPSNCVRLHGSDEGQKWETISNAIDEYEFSVYQPYVLRAQVIQMVFMGMTDVEGQF